MYCSDSCAQLHRSLCVSFRVMDTEIHWRVCACSLACFRKFSSGKSMPRDLGVGAAREGEQ